MGPKKSGTTTGIADPVQARLTLVILAVRDVREATRFYSEAFRWPIAVSVPPYTEYSLPGQLRFGVYQRENFGANTGQVPHLVPAGALAPTELYLYVDDPGAAASAVVVAGGSLLSACSARPWGDEAAYCRDPDGNVIALARPVRT